jgi:ankyrin repeat protein
MSRSPVSRAAAKGDLSALESAVRETPEAIEKPDASGQTPLIIAAIRGHAAIVQALLRAGADPNKPSSGEFAITALYEAARGGHVPVIDALLGSGAQVVVGRFDALQNAISASKEDAAIPLVGYIDDVNQAINFSLGVDQPYVSEGTYLMFAAWKGLTGVVESLLQAGADPGLTSAAGRTALDYASGNDGARALLRAALKDIPDTRDSGTAEHFT